MGILNFGTESKVLLSDLVGLAGFSIGVFSLDIKLALEKKDNTELANVALNASHTESLGGLGVQTMAQLVAFHALDMTQFALFATDRVTGQEQLRKLSPINLKVTDRARVSIDKWSAFKGVTNSIDVNWVDVFGKIALYFDGQAGNVGNVTEQKAVMTITLHLLDLYLRFGDHAVNTRTDLRNITKGQAKDSFINFHVDSSSFTDVIRFGELANKYNLVSTNEQAELSE